MLQAASLLALLAGAAPATESVDRALTAVEATERTRVLVLDLDVAGVEPAVQRAVQGIVVDRLARYPELQVFAADDLRTMVALEEQRQTAGCETTSCLAELAGAMGARFVVFGSLSRVGAVHVLALSLYDAEKARPVGRQTQTERDPQRLIGRVPAVVDGLLVPLGLVPEQRAPTPTPVLVYAAAGTSALAGLIALAGLVTAGGATLVLSTATTPKADKELALLVGAPGLLGGALFSLVALGAGAVSFFAATAEEP